MKKALSIRISALLLLALGLSLVSCSSSQSADLIDFDTKYTNSATSESYLFRADHTGVYERHFTFSSHAQSGHVDFVWREASDDAIHLFAVETHYDEDHTFGELSVTSSPIYFGEDFFTTSSSAQWFIKEGSELEELLSD